ncbi:MAG TPA: hypothetical protein VKI40_11315 [Terriglobales bacterium]|nr:hypothetical protein [Terriglobales bacterium]
MSASWVDVNQFATCKYCGAANLAWLQSKRGTWYLAEAHRQWNGIAANRRGLHICASREQRSERPSEPSVPLVEPRTALVTELITAGYRALAMKYHPDRGGNTESMQQVNAAVEKLRAVAR